MSNQEDITTRAFLAEPQRRALTFTKGAVDEEAKTVEMSFASEEPVERYFGFEVLGIDQEACDLSRLNSGAAFLVDHDASDLVGVIERAWIDADKKARCKVRFGASARAQEIFRDIADGIRRLVSVGYRVIEMKLHEERNDGPNTYRVSKWQPFEVSTVAIPADASVGIGRSLTQEAPAKKEKIMSEVTAPAVTINEAEVRKTEASRSAEILGIAAHFKVDQARALKAVQDGESVDSFRKFVLETMKNKPVDSSDIGMNEKEVRKYSLLRAINALANPTDAKAQKDAAFERECSNAVAERSGKAPMGFFVPSEIQKRDLTVGTNNAGGYTVQTDMLSGSFIDVLRNKSMVMKMGAQMLTGLRGNVAIPKASGGATAYWVAENGAPTESQPTFAQVTMSPKTVGAYTDLSRRLINQSSISVEQFVQGDLAKVLTVAIDAAALHGSGSSNQPTGIASTGSIGSVAGGTNGLAPTWAHILALWSAIADANADMGNTGILTNSKVIGKLMGTLKASGVSGYICESFPNAEGFTNIAGLRTGASNNVSSTLTKGTSSGVCSAIFAGNWSDLIIGQWGELDIKVDPYTGSSAGTVRVVALQDVDIAVRNAASFAAMLDALTA